MAEAQAYALEVAAPGQPGRGRAKRGSGEAAAQQLATGRAWILKEPFEDFWSYQVGSSMWQGFLEFWTWRALRSRIEPMKVVARMLRDA